MKSGGRSRSQLDLTPHYYRFGGTWGELTFTVITASSGKEAIELFRWNPNSFDLILMDIEPPRVCRRAV
jgi:CheY-like chemotaxis protein